MPLRGHGICLSSSDLYFVEGVLMLVIGGDHRASDARAPIRRVFFRKAAMIWKV